MKPTNTTERSPNMSLVLGLDVLVRGGSFNSQSRKGILLDIIIQEPTKTGIKKG